MTRYQWGLQGGMWWRESTPCTCRAKPVLSPERARCSPGRLSPQVLQGHIRSRGEDLNSRIQPHSGRTANSTPTVIFGTVPQAGVRPPDSSVLLVRDRLSQASWKALIWPKKTHFRSPQRSFCRGSREGPGSSALGRLSCLPLTAHPRSCISSSVLQVS